MYAQTVAVPSTGNAQAGYAAPPPATLKETAQVGSPDRQRKKTTTWLIIAVGLAAACLVFSVFGAGIFGVVREAFIARLNPFDDVPVTNVAAAIAASQTALAGTEIPILAVNLTKTYVPSFTATRKTTNYSATMTQIGATRISSTTQAKYDQPRIRAVGAELPCWKMALEDHAGDEIIQMLSVGQEAIIQYYHQTRQDESQPWRVSHWFVETGNGCTCWVEARYGKILGDYSQVENVLQQGFTGLELYGKCP